MVAYPRLTLCPGKLVGDASNQNESARDSLILCLAAGIGAALFELLGSPAFSAIVYLLRDLAPLRLVREELEGRRHHRELTS